MIDLTTYADDDLDALRLAVLAGAGSWTVGDRSMAVVTYPTSAAWPTVLPGVPT